MIGRLRGILLWKSAPHVLMEVQGVGYEVEVPFTTFFKLPTVGQEMTLHTHLIVREDAHMLYGFATEAERAMFRNLIKVNGVGAKMAATILSGIAPDDFVRCVRDNDVARLVRLPGVGKKTAERLVLELKDKVKDLAGPVPAAASPGTPRDDLVSALVHLGYSRPEAQRGADKALVDHGDERFEDLLRRSLRSLSGR